ncbi:DUF2849 domain-containing protein [Sulfitobacter donghicola]|uniref:Sulfite reductase n=1 Tax=Sulfitobacter donghicola DSW-25 = KCTC 12864 = JCM 14565 TaxID=1300350 RepID=A0A073IY05_9RHOB|nr:DUF2849 domain-containing protein [Sulfitobacter donghicola]KEJ90267.1 sulfite reductase [Sulfitobacter donghicola DSW-25 = KCTC 12864 = JCM 14565]KIN66563.1 DUF2849 domain containing protein [Sulfitobacter donghicola DSW-25 = KCTC 12864 = JCM 14565]
MAKAFKPSVITANDLLEGDVVYLSGADWVRALSDAEVIADEAEANDRLTKASARAAEVVGVYLTPVATEDGTIQTTHFREEFRATGPSNYAHGKQERA